MHHSTDRIIHTHRLCYTSRGALAGTRNIVEERMEMIYLMTHSVHFIYGYVVEDYSDIQRGNLLTRLHRLLFFNGYFICTSSGALAGTRNSSMGPPHEGSIRRPIEQNALTTELHLAPCVWVLLPKHTTDNGD